LLYFTLLSPASHSLCYIVGDIPNDRGGGHMKAAQISNYGENDQIKVTVSDQPVPQQGQILVQVKAAAINPFEISILKGSLKEKMPFPMPITMGGDFAGVVTGLGDGVTEFAIGDEVYGQGVIANGGSGTLAEYVAANTKNTARRPLKVGFEETASLPLSGVSALQAIEEHAMLGASQKILIHGGAGGIGSLAIQIARHHGAYVATTVGADDVSFVIELGADEAIDYKSQKFEEIIKDYDVVFDTVGGDVTSRSLATLKKGGKLITMIGPIDMAQAESLGVTGINQSTAVTTARLERLATLVNDGVVKPVIDTVFPLDKAAEAYELLENGHPRGKVVVLIS
jgi:alcohol dehydrogenase